MTNKSAAACRAFVLFEAISPQLFMLKIYHRAAEDFDLKAMTRSRGSLWRNVIFVSLPTAIILFAVIYSFWRSVLAATIVAGGLFLASMLSNISFFREVRRRQRLKVDTSAVEVLEVSADPVWDIQFVGDNGPAFCFFVDAEQVLLLVGQWLLEYDSFPYESFRLHRWSDTKQPIRIEAIGSPIRATDSAVQLKPGYRFGKIELFDATPETLQNDLEKAFSRAQ